MCRVACDMDRCTALGVEPKCVLGRCVFSDTCDESTVSCERVSPNCPAGQKAIVRNNCWVDCIDVRECNGITSCDDCASDQACVNAGELSFFSLNNIGLEHCFDIAPECNGTASCACMGSICQGISCGDNTQNASFPADIGCFCPTC